MGYHRAGFEVVGVDHVHQKNYPFAFVQADALEYLERHGREFDALAASPPCQAFTQMSARWRGKGTRADGHPDLLTPARAALGRFAAPWVIENVPGARRRMGCVLTLHGGMFGLRVHRPRLFESNVLLLAPKMRACRDPVGVYGDAPDGRWLYRYRNNGNYKGKSVIRAPRSLEEAREAMGIDWMEWSELKEAVPPAYTQYLGVQLLRVVESCRG